MVTIREEKIADVAAREALLDEAYGPARFAKTSERLREGRLPANGLSLVAVEHGQLVGTVRLWNVSAGPGRAALLLGPLAVHPAHRNRGIGTTLVRRAIARARLAGHGAILLVGDAPYYGRFGFSAASTGGLWMPGRYDRDRLLALELKPGALDGARGLIGAAGRLAPAARPRRPGGAKIGAPKALASGAFARPSRKTSENRGRHGQNPRRLFRFRIAADITALLLLEAWNMTEWPVHARITGPIVMIGFGSIGKGTLPLIERHFDYDKSRFVVIDPEDKDRKLLDDRGIRFIHQAVTRDNYRKLLGPLLTEGGGQGFCVNLSVDTSSLDIMEFCREIGVLYIDTVVEPWAGVLLRFQARPGSALELCAARDRAGGAPQEPRRHHGGVVLRRQSRHGVVVRQAGAAQHRRRPQAEVQGAEDPRGVGQARQEGRRQGHPHRRARHPARHQAEADRSLRQYLVGRRLSVGRHAAGRARLGHPREEAAEERLQA